MSRRHGMVLRAPLLTRFPWLVHGFSTRLGGVSSLDGPASPRGTDLNLGESAWDTADRVAENRRRFIAALPAARSRLVLQRQIHSDLIRTLDGACAGPEARTSPRSTRTPGTSRTPAGDGLITDRPGLLLGVLTADCLPILLVDARQRMVSALHCGWRGTARHLAEKAVGQLRMLFGSRPGDLWAAIGPGIRDCCYAVGPEVVDEFSSQFTYGESLFVARSRPFTPLETKRSIMILPLRSNFGPRSKEEIYLDLVLANTHQLRDAGIPEEQIATDAPCTHCNPKLFFSHRRDGECSGRMLSVIGIRKRV